MQSTERGPGRRATTILDLPEEVVMHMAMFHSYHLAFANTCSRVCKSWHGMFKEPLNLFLRFQFFWNKVGTMQQALKNASMPARPLLHSMFELGVPALVTQNIAYRNVLNNIPEHIKFMLQIDKEYERAFQYCRFRGALVSCPQCRESQRWMKELLEVYTRALREFPI